MSKFLVKYDFVTLIKEVNLDEITESDDIIIDEAIDESVEEAAGYIRHRYDELLVFKVVKDFDILVTFQVDDRVFWSEEVHSATKTYAIGDRVSFQGDIFTTNTTIGTPEAFDPAKWDFLAQNNTFYTVIVISIGNLPSNTAFFTLGDNRNQKLKTVVIDILLYNLHSRLSPRMIPELRRIRYDGDGKKNDSANAIRWLEMVQKGSIAPNLQEIVDAEGVSPQNTETLAFGVSNSSKHKF